MSQFGDVLKQGLTAAEGFGGDVVKGVGDVGGAIGKEAMALPGQIEGLFGMGQNNPTGVGASGNPISNAAAGAVNGTTGAVGPAAMSAGGSAGTVASAAPSDLNFLPQGYNPDGTNLTGVTPGMEAAVMQPGAAPSMGGIGQGAGSTATPIVDPSATGNYMGNLGRSPADTAALGGQPDAVAQALAHLGGPAAGAAPATAGGANPFAGFGKQLDATKPNALQSLLHTLTQPDMLKMELPGALFGLNAINAMQPSAQEKAMKAELANAQRLRTGEQNLLTSEQNGYLPSALQQGIDLREQQAEAAVRQRYDQAGMSGSTAEAADIAAAKTDAALQTFQEAQSLIGQTGQLLGGYNSEVGQYLSSLFAAESARDAALRQSITGFLSAAGYGRPDDSASKNSTK
jgi:hypothetical protein